MYSLDIQASKPYQVLIDTFLLERAGEIARSLNAGRAPSSSATPTSLHSIRNP